MSTETVAFAERRGAGAPARAVRSRTTSARCKVVWQRELIRFVQDRGRAWSPGWSSRCCTCSSWGPACRRVAGGSTSGVNFRTFIFPGVLALATMFTAIFSAGSIVWDREFGFLREMLVAPVSRGARS